LVDYEMAEKATYQAAAQAANCAETKYSALLNLQLQYGKQ
jgi:hypothetical protein